MFPNSTISNVNKNLSDLDDDFFYHLYMGKKSHDLKEMFGDVKVSYQYFNTYHLHFL